VLLPLASAFVKKEAEHRIRIRINSETLVSYSEVPKLPSRGAEHRIKKIPEFAKNDLRMALQNFVFLSFWPVMKMEDA
jgi:hypothetical protein